MEWIGPLRIGILVLGGVFQLFWAYAISAIAQKTEQSEFMQVLAWIPLLQIAPTLAAGGGSVGRFLVGSTALIVGNVALLAVAAFLADAFGQAVAALGVALSGLLCVFYFGASLATPRTRAISPVGRDCSSSSRFSTSSSIRISHSTTAGSAQTKLASRSTSRSAWSSS